MKHARKRSLEYAISMVTRYQEEKKSESRNSQGTELTECQKRIEDCNTILTLLQKKIEGIEKKKPPTKERT